LALFFREIPDKKYSWRDFTERGPHEAISGFYAFGAAMRQLEAIPSLGSVKAERVIMGV
jgi:hypothetical protein